MLTFFSAELTAKYFEMLNNDEITKLYKKYEDDFIMFNYTFQFRDLVFPP